MVGARLRSARFFVLQCQCYPPSVPVLFLRASECCPPPTVNVRSVPPFLRALNTLRVLSTVSAHSFPLRLRVLSTVSAHSVPPCLGVLFTVSVRSAPPLTFPRALHPQSAVHRQCPFCSSLSTVSARCVPPCLSVVHRQLVGKATTYSGWVWVLEPCVDWQPFSSWALDSPGLYFVLPHDAFFFGSGGGWGGAQAFRHSLASPYARNATVRTSILITSRCA